VNAPDPTLPSVAVPAVGEPVGRLARADVDAARAELLVAQAAALAGQAEAMLAATVTYLGEREQFGVPIGSFQALRHRAADLATETYAAHRMSLHAAQQLEGHPQPLVLGLLAKAFVGAAAVRTASEAVQLHGGMGFTWEGGVHFGLKRIVHLATTGPTVAECEERLGRWAASGHQLLWAGGLEEVPGTTDITEGTR
jgi:alkylation response protein AidB-like acyl-CoA dehydrogenase